MPLCSNCGKENAEDARFCAACGVLLAAPAASPEVRKTVTVVFCDLAGSTSMGERLDPESVRRVMSRYYAKMRSALEQHGGTVAKFIGDAVMAVFGIPTRHEDDALRAVRAAADMRNGLTGLNDELQQRWGVRLQVRTGVNTGKVVAGDPAQGQVFVVGDAVNVAARLEQTAGSGEILIGEETYHLVRDAVTAEPTEPLVLKGKAEPFRAFKLLEVAPSRRGFDRRLDSPIVGRERELKTLQEAFGRAVQGSRCQLCTVVGPAGIGKSRLTEEFIGALDGQARVLKGRCLPYGEGITYWPVAEIVRQMAGLAEDDSAADARAKIAALLPRDQDAARIVERVGAALGISESASSSEETFWGVRRLLQALAAELPLVVIFDDIHWGEATFLDLIEHLAKRSGGAPMFLFCLARSELLESRPYFGNAVENATIVALEPLVASDSQRLITNLVGEGELAEELARRVGGHAGGNPLYIGEMIRMLVDEGLLERVNGSWHAGADTSDLKVPPTIEALLAARLDQLGEQQRALLERASVVGQEFWTGALQELCPEIAPHVADAHLESLLEKELIRRHQATFAGENAYSFTHMLVRDVAYNGLLKESRSELHERFADWLQDKVGERAAEYAEILGYHRERAYRYLEELGPLDGRGRELARRAGQHLGSAGNRAFARGDSPASAKLLGRALSLLPADSPMRAEFLLNQGTALYAVGELAPAEQALADAVNAARVVGDRGLELHAAIERSALRVDASSEGYTEELRQIVEEAIPAFEELGDELGLARAYRRLANVHSDVCHWGKATECLRRALLHAERAGDSRVKSWVLAHLGKTVLLGPAPVEQGIRWLKQLIHSGGPSLGDPAASIERATQAEVECGGLAELKAMQGRFGEARALCAHARSTFEELGQSLSLIELAESAGWIEMLAGDAAAAERELRFCYEALDQMGERGFRPVVAGQLGRALYLQGRYDEAYELTVECEELAASYDVVAQIFWRTTRAKISAHRQELAVAKLLSEEAIALASETDMLDVQADLFMDQAGILLRAERASGASAAVKQALELYEEKGNIVSAGKAKTRLAELTAASASQPLTFGTCS